MSKEFQEAEVYLKTLPKEMSREEIAEAARKLHDIFFPDAKLFSPPPVVGDLEKFAQALWDFCCPGLEFTDADKPLYLEQAKALVALIDIDKMARERGYVKLAKEQTHHEIVLGNGRAGSNKTTKQQWFIDGQTLAYDLDDRDGWRKIA